MSRAGISDEARFELALAATGRERANRPRTLVGAAALTLAAALLLAIWGLSSMRSARGAYSRALGEQADVERMGLEWEKLNQQESEAGPGGMPGVGKPIDHLYDKMEQLAVRAGVKDKPQPPRANETTRGGVKVIEYNYTNVRDPSVKVLLEWARLAAAEIPGMEVYGLTLKPDQNNWNLNVTFRRWERVQ